MRQRIVSTVAALALLAAGGAAAALDAGFVFRSSNLQFPWDEAAPIPATVTTFPADNLFWGGEAWVSESLGEEADVRVSYERDPVLRNSVTAAVQFERGIARISVGPRIGLFNDDETPFSAGLSATVRLQWPGVAYVSMRSDGGLSVGVLSGGADPQARAELATGLYFHNVILSGIVSAKRFNELDSSGDAAITDSWTRYALEADIFKKNVPYTLLLSMGYELRSKRFVEADKTDSLGAIVLGATATAKMTKSLSLVAELGSGFYTFGLDELSGRGPSSSSFMFSAGLGMTVNIDGLRAELAAAKAARKLAEDAAKAAAVEQAAASAEAMQDYRTDQPAAEAPAAPETPEAPAAEEQPPAD